MASAAILNWILPEVGYWATVTLAWPISISVPNLMKISSSMTEIWPKLQSSRWWPPPYWILPKLGGIFGHSNTCMANIYHGTKFDKKSSFTTEPWPKNWKFKTAAAIMLNFAKSGTLDYREVQRTEWLEKHKFNRHSDLRQRSSIDRVTWDRQVQ